MAAVVGRLRATLLQGQELVAEVDEGVAVAAAADLEVEQAAIERQGLVDVADLDGHVIEADGARLPRDGHGVRPPPLRCA